MGKLLTTLLFAVSLFAAGVGNAQQVILARTVPPDDNPAVYMQMLQDHVDNHWAYVKTPDNQSNVVQAELILNKDGYVLEMKILKLSSDDTFNDSALKALVSMEPYPPIPDSIGEDKVEVEFHLMPNS